MNTLTPLPALASLSLERPRVCVDCGAHFMGLLGLCAGCAETRLQRELAVRKVDEQKVRQRLWLRLCPPLYRDTDWTRPGLAGTLVALAQSWWPGGAEDKGVAKSANPQACVHDGRWELGAEGKGAFCASHGSTGVNSRAHEGGIERKDGGHAAHGLAQAGGFETLGQGDAGGLPTHALPNVLGSVADSEAGHISLLLVGDTGLGKTRAAFAILHRVHAAGRSVHALHAGDAWDQGENIQGLSSAVRLQYSEEPRTAQAALQCLHRARTCSLLLLDDLGKERAAGQTGQLSEAVSEALFALIEHRLVNSLPMIVTTNAPGTALQTRLGPDRGGPLMRRLMEVSTVVGG